MYRSCVLEELLCLDPLWMMLAGVWVPQPCLLQQTSITQFWARGLPFSH